MDYFVIGPDGKEYGPASLETLTSWVAENRILPTTMLKNFQSGQTVPASSIAALFPPAPVAPQAQPGAIPQGNWTAPPSMAASYPRGGGFAMDNDGAGGKEVLMAIVRSVLALVFFFVLKGIGLVFAIYGVVWAFRAREQGHKLANVAIGISIATLIAVGIGWALRLSGGPAT